ncbi:MAG: hypothetical protein A2W31_19000 [Planctomycetes bacterium RBG_16_64_10]|nr:MAG: hypothetical protein A2W31_19000 [Planctomycetes bacterium RBG_16_64_10]
MTVIGRRARLQSGGEVLLWNIGPDGKLVQRPEHYGTHVDVVPRLTDKHDLRLELRFEYSEVDRTRTVLVAGKENPAIRKRVVVTALDMKFGETFALSGPSQAAGGGETGSASMVLLVTAEAVEPTAAAQPSDRPQRQ